MGRTGKKKPIKKPRITPKKKAIQSLFILAIILLLCIVMVYLIPENINREKGVIRYDSGNGESEDVKGKEDITRNRENPDKKDIQPENTTLWENREKHGEIVVVIDDAGNNIEDLLPFLQFPGKLTIAVLPQLPYSTEAADLAYEAGKEVLLHLPMEAVRDIYPGPGTLYLEDTKDEIIQKLKENLDTVPRAVGVNNHMGSKLTADLEKMEIIFRYLHKHNLFFLDSRTTGNSVCRETASFLGMPLLERHIFLDYKVDKEIIREQMKKGIALARKNKYVILIGHVQNEEVLDVLYEFLPELEQNHYVFTGISEIYGK